jgi:hypothetical protein
MAIRRRTSREVYRVYSEEAYLAEAHELGRWYAPPVKEDSRERRLRGLGGAAALTGAVGVVGGVIVFVGIGARTPARQLAADGKLVTRGTPHRVGAVEGAAAVRRARALGAGAAHHAGVAARRAAVARSAERRPRMSAPAARSASSRRVAERSRTAPAGPMARRPAVVYDAAQEAPAEVATRSQTQSEFGFER